MGPFDPQTLRAVRIQAWSGRASWPVRLALAASAAVVILLALLLVLPALFVGGLVFLGATGLATARRHLARLAGSDGRRNVRVIVRDES